MKKLLLRPIPMLKPDDLHRLEEQIEKDLEKKGWSLIPDYIEVFEVDDGKED